MFHLRQQLRRCMAGYGASIWDGRHFIHNLKVITRKNEDMKRTKQKPSSLSDRASADDGYATDPTGSLFKPRTGKFLLKKCNSGDITKWCINNTSVLVADGKIHGERSFYRRKWRRRIDLYWFIYLSRMIDRRYRRLGTCWSEFRCRDSRTSSEVEISLRNMQSD